VHVATTIQCITCIIGVKISRKIYILYDFWCAQTSLFVPSRFCFWTIRTLTPSAKPLYSDVREKNHRPIYYVHINILGPKQYCVEFFFKSLSYLYKVCEQTFPPIFGLSTVFDRNFANIVAPATWQCKWASERAIISEKMLKKHQNRPINHGTILFQTMSPRTGRPSVANNKHRTFAPF